MADGRRSTGAGRMRVRTLVGCDLCLGTRDCRAERLLDSHARDLHWLCASARPRPHIQPAATQPT
jgi:hypothetical protein